MKKRLLISVFATLAMMISLNALAQEKATGKAYKAIQKDEKVIGCVFSNVYPPIGERFSQGAYGYEGYGNYSKADR